MSQPPSSGRLTTHILDTMHGGPARDVRIQLYRLSDDARDLIADVRTNEDGRCARPLLDGSDMVAGMYELVFHVGDYFAAAGVASDGPRFLNEVQVRFGIAAADQHYHVPLLVAPYGYSTYRGS